MKIKKENFIILYALVVKTSHFRMNIFYTQTFYHPQHIFNIHVSCMCCIGTANKDKSYREPMQLGKYTYWY